ncbi:MAG: hypothetical protein KUG57_00930, partial [Ilumatobacteraceae bacterium]|nr:hypothetical protein [Ilumatobacteraceae bacterium]
GDLVGSTDMSPCLDSPAADCARYSPDSPYVLAIEVFVGGLEPLGLLPGAHVELIPNSESATCQSNAGV